ncbi:MAG: fasciclin domain-containing protein [Tetrasphaera sp.]|jgi:uncharacterized surface protein with fasciclin (FAS1) repeats|nr:fasciclin domain-containing protein [Tetrasphaera sp.]
MRVRRLAASVAGFALAATAAVAIAPAAQADHHGTNSLAAVLLADGNQFDGNWADYDIVTEAALAVLAAKPDSPVKVLTDGTVPLTAFLPNDRAFRLLVHDLTGKTAPEPQVFATVASLGIDTVEAVLLYHVVPGATITSAQALQADGATLTTAQGGTFKVDVVNADKAYIKLIDQDPDAANPWIMRTRLDINSGNVQIAHGISRVLRPVNL